MKLIKTASGEKQIKMSKKEWQSIGKKAGWMKSASGELEMGIKVEKEHKNIYDELKKKFGDDFPWTLDQFAEKVAKAHLEEIKDYYTRLKKMEQEAKKAK